MNIAHRLIGDPNGRRPAQAERNRQIILARLNGRTFLDIAREHGPLSSQRVRRIFERAMLRASEIMDKDGLDVGSVYEVENWVFAQLTDREAV